VARRHNSDRVLYQGDNRAIIRESLANTLELLVSDEGTDGGITSDSKNSQLFRVEDGSIKVILPVEIIVWNK